MTRCLLKAGHKVKVYDVVGDRMQALVAEGAESGTRQSVAANVDVVITMLPTGDDVKDLLVATDGLFSRAKKDTLFIDSSSIDAQVALELAAEARQADMEFVDAPVSGGVPKATAGTLTFMVGGTDIQFARARCFLEAMGEAIIHAGSTGAGQTAKFCNNMMVGIFMIAISEAFGLASRMGLELNKLYEICKVSSSESWVLMNHNPIPGLVATSPANSDYKPGFASRLMLKDLDLSQLAANRVGLYTPLGTLATELYRQFVHAGYGELDCSAIVKMIAKLTKEVKG
jgi:3-hydroxyisobutyrate dehydrogenase